MRQARVIRRPRPRDWQQEPLPLDPRDPDIVRAKELARRQSAPRTAQQARRRPA